MTDSKPQHESAPPKPALDAFNRVDEGDWERLFGYLPANGYGIFWKSVFDEVRAILAAPVPSPDGAAIRWQRVNDEPFEYAIQQDQFGDEFLKLINGSCLRRAMVTESALPFAWTIPGDDQADCNGFIPTKVHCEGEFTKLLYTSPQDVGIEATVSARDAVIEEVWQQFNDYTDNHMMPIKAIKAVVRSLASGAKS